MSWLNNQLNTIKGQLSTLAQEVLAETAGPGDEDYQGLTTGHTASAEQTLATEKDIEIEKLHKQIAELQAKFSETIAGSSSISTTAANTAAASASGATSKSPTENNAAVLEDSWCWEPENNKTDNDRTSDSSSGNGNEMVNITLEEVPLGSTAKTSKRGQQQQQQQRQQQQQQQRVLKEKNAELQSRLQQLETENQELNKSLEQLDSEHNLAMQNVLEHKSDLQAKLVKVTQDYEILKKEHADKFINSELEYGKLKKQFAQLEKDFKHAETEKQTLQSNVEAYAMETKKLTNEIADLQKLLAKKNDDNLELIEKVKIVAAVNEKFESEHGNLLRKLDEVMQENEELRNAKEKKTSESSTSSSLGKQSEDEFIVVREADASSVSPTSPPTKEELKDKIVQLEAHVAELKLENSNNALKLQDRETEKELASNILKENLQSLQKKTQKQEEALKTTREQLEKEQELVKILKSQHAADDAMTQNKLLEMTNDKTQIEKELSKLQMNLKDMVELEKRLLFSEQEKESLQLELQAMRTTEERLVELQAELEKIKNNKDDAELQERLQKLTEENNGIRAQLDAAATEKFRQAIAEEKEITDLDDDDVGENYTIEKLLHFVDVNSKRDNSDSAIPAYKALHEKLCQFVNMEKKINDLSEELVDWQDQKIVWEHEKTTLDADISQYIIQCNDLMKNNEILLNEIENCKRNKLETINENNEENMLQLECQLDECTKLNRTLEDEYTELNAKICALENEKEHLNDKLRSQQFELENHNAKVDALQLKIQNLELEKCNLLFELNEQKAASETDAVYEDKQRVLETLNAQLTTELLSVEKATESLKNAKILLQNELEAKLKDNVRLAEQLQAAEQRYVDKCNELQAIKTEFDKLLQDKKEQLQQYAEDYNKIAEENKLLLEKLEATNELDALMSKTVDLQQTNEKLQHDKEDMMKVLGQKHNENLEYYKEIQRLQQIEQALQAQLQQQQQQQQQQLCEKCPLHEANIAELYKEIEKLKDMINFLKEKSDILTTNLMTEQTNQKLVHQEKLEVIEQNAAIRKDLERLREHLLEIEAMHTQETMEMQRDLEETKEKMLAMQEEVSHSSNAYTSASIRANQHAETLQAQFALVVQQRDELVAKLSLAEDRESKNQAALCNLQCAIEQFQNDKENDIQAATQRIRRELKAEQSKENELQLHIEALKQQLSDANHGLRAATRLTDQLELSQQTIAALREEVECLKEQNNAFESKLLASESSQTDKIEKSLIKSLLIGYVVSGNPNDKNQVLRMIASILDFTQNETDKVGLNRQQSSWLGAILGGGSGSGGTTTAATGVQGSSPHSRENLVQAFVQFLEQESQPQASRNSPMPNLLNITQSTPGSSASQSIPSRRTSVASNSGGGVNSSTPLPIQQLQLNSNVLDDFAPTRNSSSILKDILNDS